MSDNDQHKSNEELASFIEGANDPQVENDPEKEVNPDEGVDIQVDEETRKKLFSGEDELKNRVKERAADKIPVPENPLLKGTPEKSDTDKSRNLLNEPNVQLTGAEEDHFWDQFLFGVPLSIEIPLRIKNQKASSAVVKLRNRTAFENNVLKLSMYLLIKEYRALDNQAYAYYYQMLTFCICTEFTTMLPEFSPYKCDSEKSVSENAQELIKFMDKFTAKVNEQAVPVLFRALRTFETKQALFGDRCQDPLS